MDEIARFLSSSHWRVAEIASLRAGDTCLAAVPVFLLWESLQIDRHVRDEFFDFLEVPWPQMSKTTMPSVVREWLWWLSRLVGFAPNRFERMFFDFVAHHLEVQKLAVGNYFRHVAEEDIRPFGRVHAVLSLFPTRTLLESRLDSIPGTCNTSSRVTCTCLAFNRDTDAPGADAVELSLRCVDFNWSIKGCLVDQNVFVRREVFRGARIEAPMIWISAIAVAVPSDMGLPRRLHCLCHGVEGNCGLCWNGCLGLQI